MGKRIIKTHVTGTQTKPIKDASFIRVMSDEEALRRAKSDPDAQPLTPEQLKKFKRVNPDGR